MRPDERKEWLESDGLGGFASGTATGVRTRRYHAWLLTAATPPTGRVVLVNGCDAWLETPAGRHPLTSQRYDPEVIHPDGVDRLKTFSPDPWPEWRHETSDGVTVVHSVLARHETTHVLVRWRVTGAVGKCALLVRPFFSGRDYHALHHENTAFQFEPQQDGPRLTWRVYDGIPAVTLEHNGFYQHQPDWYRHFRYAEEAARGLDCVEDLASPGVLRWVFEGGHDPGGCDLDAVILLSASVPGAAPAEEDAATESVSARADRISACERARRAAFPSRLHRSAGHYLVRRGTGRTIVAGYPWFTDWGRDTFIALRGLCLAAGCLDEARQILIEWSRAVSEGMLPNRFPDHAATPEFNSVDASLWYVIAVHDFLAALSRSGRPLAADDRALLAAAADAIVDGYAAGTRFGIRADADGLLCCGERGVQLTWMDAKVGDWVVTPRIGKPVEVQALWLNALWVTSDRVPAREDLLARGLASFSARFWNPTEAYLHDVVDVNHIAGTADAACRPNQVLALGGLPLTLLPQAQVAQALDVVERRLWTPLGLRSLAPDSPGYAARYEGGPAARDGLYHQGTVWPWLAGPFIEAWLRLRGHTPAAKAEARQRFLAPLLAHLDEAGLGHVSEIADAEAPHTPRGCPFQAWSVGEVLRLDQHVLSERDASS
jgi:predicted glycogen debranching enzyme